MCPLSLLPTPPAPRHPAEDRDKLCHSIPKALPTPGSHPAVPGAQGLRSTAFPIGEHLRGVPPWHSGVTAEARGGHRAPVLATAMQPGPLDVRPLECGGAAAAPGAGTYKARERDGAASLHNRAAGRGAHRVRRQGWKMGQDPPLGVLQGPWGCRVLPLQPGAGFGPQHKVPGAAREEKTGRKRCGICTRDSSAGK